MPNSALARSSNAKDIPSLIQNFSSETIGSLEETKATLLELFPDIKQWHPERYTLCGEIMNILIGSGAGRDVTLQRIGEGEVLFLSVRSRDKRDITRVEERLGLRVLVKRFGPVDG